MSDFRPLTLGAYQPLPAVQSFPVRIVPRARIRPAPGSHVLKPIPSDRVFAALADAIRRADYACQDCPTGRLAGPVLDARAEWSPHSTDHQPDCPALVPGSPAQEIARLDVIDALAKVLAPHGGMSYEEPLVFSRAMAA
jgi:hypothetical protein